MCTFRDLVGRAECSTRVTRNTSTATLWAPNPRVDGAPMVVELTSNYEEVPPPSCSLSTQRVLESHTCLAPTIFSTSGMRKARVLASDGSSTCLLVDLTSPPCHPWNRTIESIGSVTNSHWVRRATTEGVIDDCRFVACSISLGKQRVRCKRAYI